MKKSKLPKNVIWLSVASMFNDISGEIVIRALPLYLTAAVGLGVGWIGLIEGVAESTSALLKIISGWYSDKWGKRKSITLFGYSLTTLARPLLYLTTGWFIPLLSRFLDRAGKGIRTAPRDALIADSVEPSMRGRAFGFHRALDPLGAVFGAAVGAYVLFASSGGVDVSIDKATFELLLTIAILPTAFSVLVIALFVREVKREEKRPPDARLFRGWTREFKQLLFVVFFFTLGLSSDAFIILRARSLGIATYEIFIIITLLNVISTFSAYPAGVLADKMSRRSIILVGYVLYALFYLGFALVSSAAGMWLLYIGYGIYYGLTEGAERAWVADLVKPEKRGAAYGLFNGAVGIAVLPASLIAGLLWDAFGPQAPFFFGAATALISSVMLLFLVKRPRVA